MNTDEIIEKEIDEIFDEGLDWTNHSERHRKLVKNRVKVIVQEATKLAKIKAYRDAPDQKYIDGYKQGKRETAEAVFNDIRKEYSDKVVYMKGKITIDRQWFKILEEKYLGDHSQDGEKAVLTGDTAVNPDTRSNRAPDKNHSQDNKTEQVGGGCNDASLIKTDKDQSGDSVSLPRNVESRSDEICECGHHRRDHPTMGYGCYNYSCQWFGFTGARA